MSRATPDVILIRGAPGSGKSQSAKFLAKHYPKGVRMEIDTLRSMVVSVDWTNQAEHIAVLSLSTILVLGFLKQGFCPVIVVDTFSGDKLTQYLAELQQRLPNLVVRSFSLVAASDELRRRLESRSADEFKDFAISAKLNAQVSKHRHSSEPLIDTTALTPEVVAERILGHIEI